MTVNRENIPVCNLGAILIRMRPAKRRKLALSHLDIIASFVAEQWQPWQQDIAQRACAAAVWYLKQSLG